MELEEIKIKKYIDRFGRIPDLNEPKTFTEKLLRRVIFDNDPYYYLYGTKLYVPYFLQNRYIKNLNFAKRYGVFRRIQPDDILNIDAERLVLKSSWASGLNQVIINKRSLDLGKICERFNNKIDVITNAKNFNNYYNCIIAEEYLGDKDNSYDFKDFRFHCFRDCNKKLKINITYYENTHSKNERQCNFDENFNRLNYSLSNYKYEILNINKPESFEIMKEIASNLSLGFDYIRVDLVLINNKIYFGELTPYQSAGITNKIDLDIDIKLGEYWHYRNPSFDPSQI